jgi:hypothetical protein
VSETKALAEWSTHGYEVWEYGEHAEVRFGSSSGDLDDLIEAMSAGGIDHTVVVNCFTIDEWRNRELCGPLGERGPSNYPGSLAEQMFAFNDWLVSSVRDLPTVSAFVAMDPWVATSDVLEAHLADMRGGGALGVKVHPVEQRFMPSHPRSISMLRACAALDMPVVTHSGPARGPLNLAQPSAFARCLAEVGGLRLVVAHMGGASWKEAGKLAADHPTVAFDCSEIVSWLRAPNAPTPEELVAVIRDVGVDRVMFGSDFPWYDPGPTADLVRDLPGLSTAETDVILGENAVRLLRLPI